MRKALSFSAAALVMLVSAKASASYHLMKVVEVFAGSATAPNASYIQLQMYAAGQNFVGGHIVHVYDSAGVEIAANTVTLSGNVANGSDQANILIGTSSVAAAFGVVPDFTLPQNLVQAGGAVCFDVVDCFSWGNFAPASTVDGAVTPFNPLTANKAARRSIASGDPALLEAADDSNNVFADFTAVDPAPKNNTGQKMDGGTTPVDAGKDSSTPPATKDSGIGTQPSPNNPTVSPDSGTTTEPSAGSSGGDSGCSFAPQSSGGWSTIMGLFAAGSLLAMSRRRRRAR